MADLVAIPGLERVVALTVCASNRQNAGKAKRRAPARLPHLKTMLCKAATSAARKKGSDYRDMYCKLRRVSAAGAAPALAHKLLIALYKVLSGETFCDLGESNLDRSKDKRRAKSLVE